MLQKNGFKGVQGVANPIPILDGHENVVKTLMKRQRSEKEEHLA